MRRARSLLAIGTGIANGVWWMVCAMVGFAAIAYVSMHVHSDGRRNHMTEIRCVDSITGQEVDVECRVAASGKRDDDLDAKANIRDGAGKLICERNVWVDVDLKAPRYVTAKVRLDDGTPDVLVVRMHPWAAAVMRRPDLFNRADVSRCGAILSDPPARLIATASTLINSVYGNDDEINGVPPSAGAIWSSVDSRITWFEGARVRSPSHGYRRADNF